MLKKLVVTARTSSLNIHKFYVLPSKFVSVFSVNLRTEIIFPYNINLSVLMTETECVYELNV
jgi:hypothetical protein